MPEYLFAYGTLLPGRAPRDLQGPLQQMRPVGSASVAGWLYDLGEYPGAILDPRSESNVLGQVFELPAEPGLLTALDAYEGFDSTHPASNLFVRDRCDATMPDGQTISCWVYVYNRDPGDAPLIAGGDYSQHRPASEER
jgi:gamma-glutamylcyclotransferase (GGCT)/AIG2-like uncharacterized protein YtfP